MAVRIQLRRDTAANWTSANPTLSQGEIGYETDTNKQKIGDGSTAWTSLVYDEAPIIVTGSLTAINDKSYTVTASATFTDPTPVQGKGFTVFVRNGTATVGGTGYSTAGTLIYRVYDSGAWATYAIGAGAGGDLLAANNLSDLASVPTARNNLGISNSFTSLVDGSTVTWNTNSYKFPQAKLTSTQSFTINMTNVLDGAHGVLKITTNTASAITITFDTDFTNKIFNQSTPTYTLPAGTSQEYFLHFIVDGTTIEWIIIDGVMPATLAARCRRILTTQSLTGAANTAISFDTEDYDNAGIWTNSNPTRFTIPGTGNKLARIDCLIDFGAVSGSASNYNRLQIYLNGSGYYGAVDDRSDTGSALFSMSASVFCTGGQYIELYGRPSVAKNVNASLNITIFNV